MPKFESSISLGNVLSLVLLLGALAGAWHALATRLTVVEVNQITMSTSITELKSQAGKTQNYLLAHNPDFLNLVGKSETAFPVHKFGMAGALGGESMPADAPALLPMTTAPAPARVPMKVRPD